MDDSILKYYSFNCQIWQNKFFDLRTWSAGVCYTYNPPDKSDTLLTSRCVREKCQRWNIIVKNQRLIALIGNNDQLENSSYPLEGRLEQDQEKMRILQLSSWLIIDQSGLSERFHRSEWSRWCRMSKLSRLSRWSKWSKWSWWSALMIHIQKIYGLLHGVNHQLRCHACDGRTHTWESRAVFCLNRIRN